MRDARANRIYELGFTTTNDGGAAYQTVLPYGSRGVSFSAHTVVAGGTQVPSTTHRQPRLFCLGPI
jgi:hypothetical protein